MSHCCLVEVIVKLLSTWSVDSEISGGLRMLN